MEPWGIYLKNSQSQFLFISLGEEMKRTRVLVSSLQAFETSLLMIGLGRWTNAIIHIVDSIETLLLKAAPKPKGHSGKWGLLQQIDAFSYKYKISRDLQRAGHSSRKKRNQTTQFHLLQRHLST